LIEGSSQDFDNVKILSNITDNFYRMGHILSSGQTSFIIFQLDFRSLSKRLEYLNESCSSLQSIQQTYQDKMDDLINPQQSNQSSAHVAFSFKFDATNRKQLYAQIAARFNQNVLLCQHTFKTLYQSFLTIRDANLNPNHMLNLKNPYYQPHKTSTRQKRFLAEIFSIGGLAASLYNSYTISKLARSITQAEKERKEIISILGSFKSEMEANEETINSLISSITELEKKLQALQDLNSINFFLLIHYERYTGLAVETRGLIQAIADITHGKLPQLLFKRTVIIEAIKTHQALLKKKVADYLTNYYTKTSNNKITIIICQMCLCLYNYRNSKWLLKI